MDSTSNRFSCTSVFHPFHIHASVSLCLPAAWNVCFPSLSLSNQNQHIPQEVIYSSATFFILYSDQLELMILSSGFPQSLAYISTRVCAGLTLEDCHIFLHIPSCLAKCFLCHCRFSVNAHWLNKQCEGFIFPCFLETFSSNFFFDLTVIQKHESFF